MTTLSKSYRYLCLLLCLTASLFGEWVQPPTGIPSNESDGVLIAIIPAAGPYIYIDGNRKKGEVDVYGLTAVNPQGESTPIYVIL